MREEDISYNIQEQDEFKVLIRELRGRHLLRNSYLYTVVDGDRINELKMHGTYRADDTIFAYTKQELCTDDTVCDSLIMYENPALVIWSLSCFNGLESDDSLVDWEYRFKDPNKKLDAIVAIAYLAR